MVLVCSSSVSNVLLLVQAGIGQSREWMLIALIPATAGGQSICCYEIDPLGQATPLQPASPTPGGTSEDAAAWVAQRFATARCTLPLSLHLLRPSVQGLPLGHLLLSIL